MGESEIKFGDKMFLAGPFLDCVEGFGEFETNSVIVDDNNFIHGYVVEILSAHSLASITPFNKEEMVDVTEKLSQQLPLPAGTKVWMPVTIELL